MDNTGLIAMDILPSFNNTRRQNRWVKPRILMLEVRDKDRPNEKAIGWVLIEREETYRRDPGGIVSEASICLSYRHIKVGFLNQNNSKGFFDASYKSGFPAAVSLTNGGVFLDLPELRGQRIGTYLMNEIIQWAQQWPDENVKSIKLVLNQADEDNKERRNRFYERFGLVFDYTDPEHREGVSRPMLVGVLNTVETWKQNITEHQLLDYLAQSLYDLEIATLDLQACKKTCEKLKTTLIRAERNNVGVHPLRWALCLKKILARLLLAER